MKKAVKSAAATTVEPAELKGTGLGSTNPASFKEFEQSAICVTVIPSLLKVNGDNEFPL